MNVEARRLHSCSTGRSDHIRDVCQALRCGLPGSADIVGRCQDYRKHSQRYHGDHFHVHRGQDPETSRQRRVRRAMKYTTLILAVLLAGCAHLNRVSITDATLERSANERGRDRCSITVGENILKEQYCIVYTSDNCQARSGNCEGVN